MDTGKNGRNKAVVAGAWYLVCNLLVRGLSFITAPVFNRLLDKAQVGAFSNLLSWAGVITIFATLEMYSTIANAKIDYGEEELDKYISSVLLFGTGMTLAFFFIYFCLHSVLDSFFEIRTEYMVIFLLSLLVQPATSICLAKYQILLDYKKNIVITAMIAVSTVAFSWIFMLLFADKLEGRVIGNYLPQICIAVVLYFCCLRKEFTFQTKYIKYAVKIAVPVAIHLLGGTILSASDKIMITKLCGEEMNGLYTVAGIFFTVALLFWTSANGAFSPWLMNEMAEGRRTGFHRPANLMLAAYGMFMVLVSMFAPEGLYFLGGAPYVEAAPVVPPLLCACVWFAIYTLYVVLEQYHKKQTYVAIATVGAALVNIGLNWVLIPVFGYKAAAYTTMIGYLGLYVFHLFIDRFLLKEKIYADIWLVVTVLVSCGLIFAASLLYDYLLFRIGIAFVMAVAAGVLAWKNRAGIRAATGI